MNPTWHFLISHGPKLLILAIGLWGHYANHRRKQAAKEREIRPPQSAPAAPTMAQQPIPDSTKNESSPWSNADPFNSQRPRR